MNISDIQQQQMIEKALVDSGYPVNKMNSLIQQINGQLQCGTECQKLKKDDRLKELYEKALLNIESAPQQLNRAEKNYYVETQGADYYNDVMTERYVIDADNDADSRIKKHKEILGSMKSTVANYSSAVKYRERMNELLNKILTFQ